MPSGHTLQQAFLSGRYASFSLHCSGGQTMRGQRISSVSGSQLQVVHVSKPFGGKNGCQLAPAAWNCSPKRQPRRCNTSLAFRAGELPPKDAPAVAATAPVAAAAACQSAAVSRRATQVGQHSPSRCSSCSTPALHLSTGHLISSQLAWPRWQAHMWHVSCALRHCSDSL